MYWYASTEISRKASFSLMPTQKEMLIVECILETISGWNIVGAFKWMKG